MMEKIKKAEKWFFGDVLVPRGLMIIWTAQAIVTLVHFIVQIIAR